MNINDQIRAPLVRVIGLDGEQHGIISLSEAKELARKYQTDLLEVVPKATPPVVKLQDYGKYKYDLQKKEKEVKKQQKAAQVVTKELRFRPNTGEHDLQILIRHGSKFILNGDNLKLTLMVKGRERDRLKDLLEVMRALVDRFEDITYINEPTISGRQISCTIQKQRGINEKT